MDRIGYVYFDNRFAGRLTEQNPGYLFEYDSSYISDGIPLGYNFPLSQTRYYSGTLFPLFENLLSEGWLLDIQAARSRLGHSDSFGILLKHGQDLIGAISIREIRE
ncbi:MAG: HipA N-terminal domain-containing protein [Spirochaetales bacterium]|nr:HipA N-terminal domain-containing protein [Spirochaetales bacterium]